MRRTYTFSSGDAAFIVQTLNEMSRTSAALTKQDPQTLVVDVYPPFGEDRFDNVRNTIAGLSSDVQEVTAEIDV